MNQLVILGILLIAVGIILAALKAKKETASATYEYTKIKSLMTPSERSFFEVLQQVEDRKNFKN